MSCLSTTHSIDTVINAYHIKLTNLNNAIDFKIDNIIYVIRIRRSRMVNLYENYLKNIVWKKIYIIDRINIEKMTRIALKRFLSQI